MKALANIMIAITLLLSCLIVGVQIRKAYQDDPANARTYIVDYVIYGVNTKKTFAHWSEQVTITEYPISNSEKRNLGVRLARELRAKMKKRYPEDYLRTIDIAIIDYIELVPDKVAGSSIAGSHEITLS